MRKISLCLLLALAFLLTACNTTTPATTPESTPNVTPESTPAETPSESPTETQNKTESTVKETEPVNTTPTPRDYTAVNYDDVKAMWLSQFDLYSVYTSNGKQRPKADFTARIKEILQKVKGLGINTVYVQVRPYGDSFYPSEVYPASRYVTGKYGRDFDYDPFEIVVEEGHKLGFSVHAWLNPMRLMESEELIAVGREYDIRKWYTGAQTKNKYVVKVSDRWYLNPAYDETRALVCRGAEEVVLKYDVDGVHIDDYFYPTKDESFDRSAYTEYKKNGGKLSLAAYRRDNVNKLVREMYSAIKDANPTAIFGISPAGNMKNNYDTLYADVATWCANEGYIDYICPQIYFGFEHATCAFDKLCKEFSDMIKVDSIKLIVGMTLSKAVSETDQYAGSGKDEWKNNKDVLKRQLEYTQSVDKCVGVSYFSYQYFYDPSTGERNEKSLPEVAKLLPVLEAATWKKE